MVEIKKINACLPAFFAFSFWKQIANAWPEPEVKICFNHFVFSYLKSFVIKSSFKSSFLKIKL